jgi:hypothetical protein
MKRSLFLSMIFFSALTMTAPFAMAQTKPYKPPVMKPRPIVSAPASLNILELTGSEMYRYGREMYLRGNFTEASKVFLQMLKIDCSNKVAQYHLRKIAAEVPSLAFLNAKLDRLPCKVYDFTKEDFLPASIYYEKDANLILEQLISYKKRHRLSEKEMAEKIDEYMILVKDLETTVNMLKNNTLKTSSTPLSQDILERIEKGKLAAARIEREVNFFRNQLASERLDRQKEVQDMRTLLAEAEISTDYSKDTTDLINAVAQTRAALAGKERSLVERDQTITTLQSRFDDLQRRLKAIQNDLVNKNAQIQAIQINLKDTQTP